MVNNFNDDFDDSLRGEDEQADARPTLMPIYEFTWWDSQEARESGEDPVRVRRTDELEHFGELREMAARNLAALGEEDPSCDVSIVGYAS